MLKAHAHRHPGAELRAWTSVRHSSGNGIIENKRIQFRLQIAPEENGFLKNTFYKTSAAEGLAEN